MKKKLFLLFFLILSLQSFSQITYDKGYIMNDAGTTTNVYIKFSETSLHPSQIQYKLNPDGEVNTADVSTIKEFGVGDSYKFIREKVKLDQSPQDLNSLSRDRNPVLSEETVFLRSLIEGEYSLLSYTGKNPGYFIRKPNGEIELLVYKKYTTGDNVVRKNNRYKQELMNLLKCKDITEKDIVRLNYTRIDLMTTFEKYYDCTGGEYKVFYSRKKGDLNMMAKAGVNFTNFGMDQDYYDIVEDFNYEIDPRIGLEIEYILPMVNRKLAFYMEPSFSMYQSEREVIVTTSHKSGSSPHAPGGYRALVKMNYKILDLPAGLRFYMYLNKSNNLKMFFNAGASVNLIFNSSTILNTNNDENDEFDFNQSWKPTFFGGVGIRFQEKFSIESRYFPVRPLSENGGHNLHQNHSFAIVAGYTIF